MASVTPKTGTGVKDGNGIGPVTTVLAVTVATVTMEAAAEELALTHTVVGTVDDATTAHIAVQGTAAIPTISGVATVVAFTD
jgi:hypothetical protein